MWCDKQIKLIDNIPDFFADIYEYKMLFSVLDEEISLFREYMLNSNDNLFLISSSDEIILRYQNLLKTYGSSAEQKRLNVFDQFKQTVPFNIETLKQVITRYIEADCNIDTSVNGVISVTYRSSIFLTDKSSLYTDVYNIIPANLKFFIDYLYAVYSDYTSYFYDDLSQKTWLQVKLYH